MYRQYAYMDEIHNRIQYMELNFIISSEMVFKQGVMDNFYCISCAYSQC
jgi:hypothetical protein